MQCSIGRAGEGGEDGARTVLDLSVAKVANGALVADAPEVKGGGAERVPEADGSTESIGVGLSKVDEVVLSVSNAHVAGRGPGSGLEGSGGAEDEGEDDLLHGG